MSLFRLIISILLLSWIFLPINSCNKNNGARRITFYYRDQGSNNGNVTFNDYLIVHNYQNKTMSLFDFFVIAKSYIDTVKASKPVSGVTFVGKSQTDELPEGNWDSFDQQKKYFIVSLTLGPDSSNLNSKLTYVCIWKNGTPQSFMDQQKIDSIMRVPEFLDRGL